SIGEDLIALCKDGYPGDNFFRRKIYRTFVFAMASSEEAHSEGELSTLVDDALAGERAWLEGLIVLPPRLAWESATGLSTSVSIWLSLCELKSELRNEHDPALFSLVEEIRALTGGGLQVPAGGLEASVEDLRQEAFRLREKVNGMAASLGAIDASRRSTSQQIAEAVLERDRVMARLRQSMVSSGFGSPSIDASSLGAQLPERTAAVGYRAYERVLASGETNSWMTAFVVGADGSLQRIDLGALEPIAAATEKWRTAIGSGSGRGVSLRAPQVNPEDGAREAGADLRERILDPILVAVGDVTALHVCVDSFLHLVPLDALPMGDGVVGDHLRIYNEVSFARLLSRVELSSRPPAFLVIGGVDFDAEVESDLLEATVAAAPVNLTSRGGAKLFNFLPGTLTESKRLGEAFEQQFGSAASLLVGPNATRQAVCELAPVARYFHLATHGYFAGSEVRAWGDGVEAAVNWDSDQSAQVVRGMAPLTLCGLALAGANSRMDSTGSVPGILTAEEIAGLDLSGCELAVLSACQTNVGDSRPGQGIHSLQGALHSAGVGTAMTSLWMVDDDWTQRLMTEFYDRMWLGEEGKAQALWNAKRALRDQGAPLRAWAPWVLTGAPE
ncbi:MAG: CHAT domain-containing protein, partial [Candidatus Paceibacteria bacterium]